MTEPQPAPATKTIPITPADLDALIRYHQDALFSHLYHMSPSAVYLLQQTINVLKHYRDLTHVIDTGEPYPDPFNQQPSLEPAATTDQQEKPA